MFNVELVLKDYEEYKAEKVRNGWDSYQDEYEAENAVPFVDEVSILIKFMQSFIGAPLIKSYADFCDLGKALAEKNVAIPVPPCDTLTYALAAIKVSPNYFCGLAPSLPYDLDMESFYMAIFNEWLAKHHPKIDREDITKDILLSFLNRSNITRYLKSKHDLIVFTHKLIESGCTGVSNPPCTMEELAEAVLTVKEPFPKYFSRDFAGIPTDVVCESIANAFMQKRNNEHMSHLDEALVSFFQKQYRSVNYKIFLQVAQILIETHHLTNLSPVPCTEEKFCRKHASEQVSEVMQVQVPDEDGMLLRAVIVEFQNSLSVQGDHSADTNLVDNRIDDDSEENDRDFDDEFNEYTHEGYPCLSQYLWSYENYLKFYYAAQLLAKGTISEDKASEESFIALIRDTFPERVGIINSNTYFKTLAEEFGRHYGDDFNSLVAVASPAIPNYYDSFCEYLKNRDILSVLPPYEQIPEMTQVFAAAGYPISPALSPAEYNKIVALRKDRDDDTLAKPALVSNRENVEDEFCVQRHCMNRNYHQLRLFERRTLAVTGETPRSRGSVFRQN